MPMPTERRGFRASTVRQHRQQRFSAAQELTLPREPCRRIITLLEQAVTTIFGLGDVESEAKVAALMLIL